MISAELFHKLKNKRTMERFVKEEHGGDIGKFLTDVDVSLNFILKMDLKTTGACVRSIEQMFKHLPAEYKPRLLQIKGRHAHYSGDSKAALKYYRQALRMHRKAGNTEAAARLGKGLFDVYKVLGRYDDALDIARWSLNYFRRKKLTRDVGEMLVNIGNIYHRMDNNSMALQYYRKAVKIFQKDGGYHLAVTEFNRANIYANMNQIKKARALYQKAELLYTREKLDLSVTKSRYSLAYLLFLEDRYTEALKAFEDAYTRFSELGDHRSALVAQLDMVEINAKLNQYGSAIMLAEIIIPKLEKFSMFYEQAKAYYFASDALIQLEDYDRADSMLRQAGKIFKRERNYLWMGMVSIARSRMFMARKKFSDAIKSSIEARRLFKKSRDERRWLDAEIILAETYQRAGDTERAVKLSRNLLKTKLLSYQKYNLYSIIGRSFYNAGQYGKALAEYKRAVAVVEKMLTGFYPDEIRFFFVIDKYDSYRMIVECLMRLGRIHDSFVANLRAIEVINRKAEYDDKAGSRIPREFLERRDRLRTALRKLNQAPSGEQRRAESLSAFYSLEQKLWYNERKIRNFMYPEREVAPGEEHRYDDLSRLLKKDEVVVSFFTSGNITGAFCASRDNIEFIEFNISPDDLEVLLRKLHFIFEKSVFGLRDMDRTRQIADFYLQSLYHEIFAPVVPHIRGRKVIAITDSSFSQVPLIALKDEDGVYLRKKYDIRILVNPADLKRRRMPDGEIAGSKNAIFAVSSDSLPSIDREALEIKKSFDNSNLYINESAGCTNLSKELKEVDGFIHIAAHASRSSENPLFSMILMGDGPFYPFDLFQSGVKAKLVTLSGCQTAAPGLYYGNSFSLAKAFYQAGSQHVLASLWPVSDKLSMLFMIEFYGTLAKVGNVYKAYQNAVDNIVDITDNPAFWGSFVLLGI